MKHYVVTESVVQQDTLYLSLKPVTPKDQLIFKAGQYVAISFEGENGHPSPARCFSIASSPSDGFLEFGIRIQGQFTQTLSRVTIGAKIFVLGPFGNFTINNSSKEGIVLLAGGIGITPFISMVKDATQRQSSTPITLLYGCRSEDNIPFLNELIKLEQLNKRFRIGFFISDGPVNRLIGQNAYQGIVTNKVITKITGGKYQNFLYYLCGPKGFMTGLTNTLLSDGIGEEQIFSESFSQASRVRLSDKYTASGLVYKMAIWSLVATFMIVASYDLNHTLFRANITPTTPATDSSQTTSTLATPQPINNYYYSNPTTTPTQQNLNTPAPTYLSTPVNNYNPPRTAVS